MNDPARLRSYFLSHAGADKTVVKTVGVILQLTGRDVFLDEWSIEHGESIPGAISAALRDYGTVVLFWSASAAASSWVRREFQAAVSGFIEEPDRSLVGRPERVTGPFRARQRAALD